MNKSEEVDKYMFLGMLVPFLMVVFALIRGFVLKCYWDWFLIPLGAPAVGLAHAIGLSFMVHAVAGGKYQSKEELEKSRQEIWRQTFHGIGSVVMSLAAGWIVSKLI